ncbi:hypothetical protein CA13_02170 [Planctomycetes bacterium CA13]|uniref:Uncharacterized protein n=1 Tax=Novipirellula herctigrandis TaxID=2527986 RepID=A0A5C5YVF5_9BACT|nr:hypothetical protein CA13_02170 [Planctomycetes bacterium CA13]
MPRTISRSQFNRWHSTRLHVVAVILAVLTTVDCHAAESLSAGDYVSFEVEKTSWHEEFDRYDDLMSKVSLAITPSPRPTNQQYGDPADH